MKIKTGSKRHGGTQTKSKRISSLAALIIFHLGIIITLFVSMSLTESGDNGFETTAAKTQWMHLMADKLTILAVPLCIFVIYFIAVMMIDIRSKVATMATRSESHGGGATVLHGHFSGHSHSAPSQAHSALSQTDENPERERFRAADYSI